MYSEDGMLLKNTSKLCDRLLSWADVLTGVLCDMGGVVYIMIVVVLHLLVNSVTGTMLHLLVYCVIVEVVIVTGVLGDTDGIVFTGELHD